MTVEEFLKAYDYHYNKDIERLHIYTLGLDPVYDGEFTHRPVWKDFPNIDVCNRQVKEWYIVQDPTYQYTNMVGQKNNRIVICIKVDD